MRTTFDAAKRSAGTAAILMYGPPRLRRVYGGSYASVFHDEFARAARVSRPSGR